MRAVSVGSVSSNESRINSSSWTPRCPDLSRRCFGLVKSVKVSVLAIGLGLDSDSTSRLHAFVDWCVIELVSNGHVALSTSAVDASCVCVCV